ncbi:hypothetical protein KJ980_02690 [Patescibacteria group bacterium]|nr:hypothetical protein [Patescibacteria group bacterium]MBU4098535.1 hypothetical protein [Patescibacteria group bacterium]
MHKLSKNYKYIYSLLTSPLFLTSTFFLVLFTLFTPTYEDVDDVAMTLIANGLYTGEPSAYLVFINIILGKFLTILYRIYPDWNWYSAFFYGVAFVSLFSILTVAINKIKSKALLAISLLFVFIFYLWFLLFLQFTTIAALAATSGIFLFLFLIGNNKGQSKFSYITTYSLLLVSSLIREDSFYLIIILAIPIIILTYKQHVLKRKTMIIFLLIVTLGVGTTKYIHNISYNKNSDWYKFMLLQKPRGQLSSYSIYNFDKNKQTYNEVGWSINDYFMFNIFLYHDESIFSVKKLQFILSSIKYKNFNPIILQDTLSRLISFNINSFPYILLVILISITGWSSIKNKTYFLATCSIGLFIFIYFSYLGRLPERIILPILFFIGFSGLYLTSKHNLLSLDKLGIFKITYYIFSISLILTFIFTYTQKSIENKNKIIEYQKIFKYLPDGKNKLVYIWNISLPLQWMSPFDNYSRYRNRSIITGGWTQRTPHDLLLLKRFNIDNIYTALYENNNIYLIAIPEYTELLQIFMKEHYHKNIYFVSLHNFKFTISPYDDAKPQLYKVLLKNTP